MQVLDYCRSFVTFVSAGELNSRQKVNNARLQVESVTTLTEAVTGRASRYLFFASCKSEDTFAERDLFYPENYDFNGIFGDEEYVIFRTYSTHTARFREEGLWRERFRDVRQGLVYCEGRELGSGSAVVRASLAGTPLVGRVEIESGDGALRAEMEFPIKTMNANDIDDIWQADTGPIAFPDLEAATEMHVSRLSPAYVAYNAGDFAEFVVQRPTRVQGTPVEVTHYSGIQSMRARARVIAVGGG